MTKIEKLRAFSPALIYGLVPKASPKALSGSDLFEDTLFHSVDQYNDLLEGYLFAQNDILPALKSDKEKVNSEQLLSWIKELHHKVCKHLLGVLRRESGVYSDEAILRWQHGSMMSEDLIQYFSNQHACKKVPKMADYLAKTFKVHKDNAVLFIQLLDRINKDADIPVFQFQENLLWREQKKLRPGIQVLHKLYAAISSNRLSPEERKISDEFVEACLIPAEIPVTMQMYAAITLQEFYACDKSDIDQVSSFLADSFYKFTKTHPFIKGNGRVALCLMNIFLGGWGMPTILLSHPDKHGEEDKIYLAAIKQIAVTRAPLQSLIKSKIIAAESHRLMDKTFEQLISLRIEYVEICRRILTKFPLFDPDKLKMSCYLSAEFKAIMETLGHPHEKSIRALQFLKQTFMDVEILLESSLNPNTPKFFSPNDKLTQEQGDTLRLQMTQLSGQSGWKINKRKGVVWLEMLDEPLASKTFQQLNSQGIGGVSLNRMVGKEQVWVVMCEKIDLEKLTSLSSSIADASEQLVIHK